MSATTHNCTASRTCPKCAGLDLKMRAAAGYVARLPRPTEAQAQGEGGAA